MIQHSWYGMHGNMHGLHVWLGPLCSPVNWYPISFCLFIYLSSRTSHMYLKVAATDRFTGFNWMLSAVRTHRATVATPVCYSIKFVSVINFLHADDQASKQPANMSCCRTTIVGSFMTGSIRSIQDKVINKGLASKCVIKLETWCVVLWIRGPSNCCAVCVRCTESNSLRSCLDTHVLISIYMCRSRLEWN